MPKNIEKKFDVSGYLLGNRVLISKFTHNKTFTKMKKILFVIALGVFAACGSGSSTATTTDSTAADSSAMAPTNDSTKMAPDSTTAKPDSTKMDSTKKM